MDSTGIFLALGAMLGWGVSSFFSKLASNRIGNSAVFWDVLAYAPITVLYCLFAFKIKTVFHADPIGIGWALLSGATGAAGIVLFYVTITKYNAAVAVPLTALYPALTAILAVMFLGEKLSAFNILGIVLAVAAVFLLSL